MFPEIPFSLLSMVRVTRPPRGGKSKVVFLDRPSASPSIAQPSILQAAPSHTHIRIHRRSVGAWSLGPCRKARIQPPLCNLKTEDDCFILFYIKNIRPKVSELCENIHHFICWIPPPPKPLPQSFLPFPPFPPGESCSSSSSSSSFPHTIQSFLVTEDLLPPTEKKGWLNRQRPFFGFRGKLHFAWNRIPNSQPKL